MVQPAELKLLANEWRNVAEVSRKLHKQQLELDVGGAMNGLFVVENAMAQAAALDERCEHLEMMSQRSR